MSPHTALRVIAHGLGLIGSVGCHRVAVGAPVTPPHVRITFVPQSDSFAAAARDYQRMWAVEETRIIAAMERISGPTFISRLR
jgi:hypothetical protein